MAASFLGARVAVQLRTGHDISGTIANVDASSGSLGIRLNNGQHIVVPRHDIADLKILPAASTATPQQPGASSSAATNSHVQIVSEPARQNAPAQYSHILTRETASPKPSNGKARQRAKTPDPQSVKMEASSSKQSKKAPKKKNARPASSSAADKATATAEDETESNLDEDFDFDKALKSFDKKKIWEEIKTSDHSDPSLLLVSHNRRARQGNAMQNEGRDAQDKLAWNEPVLSPSPPPTAARTSSGVAEGAITEHTNGLSSMQNVSDEVDRVQTNSLQRDIEIVQLREQLQRLQAKTAVLESLAGVDVEEITKDGPSKEQAWRVRVYESVAAHSDARRRRSQQTAARTTAEDLKGSLTFNLSTETAATKAADQQAARSLAKLRYLGADASQTDPAILARLPPQYKNQMGLKPESASIFLRRVKDAVQGASSTP